MLFLCYTNTHFSVLCFLGRTINIVAAAKTLTPIIILSANGSLVRQNYPRNYIKTCELDLHISFDMVTFLRLYLGCLLKMLLNNLKTKHLSKQPYLISFKLNIFIFCISVCLEPVFN